MSPPPPRRDAASARPGLAARDAAVRLLAAVLDDGRSLDAELDADGGRNTLPLRDRALGRAIVGTALRRHGEIAAVLGRLVDRPPARAGNLMRILETAAAQILFMEVADHAAVSIAVDQVAADPAARRYKGLANAVLRRIAGEGTSLLAGLDAGVNTPAWLWQRWCATYGEADARRIAEMHRLEPYLDLSVKSDPQAWAERLGGTVLPTGTVRTVASGLLDTLPGYGAGAWWVQDAAAALPARLLGDVAGRRVADLCAAPGGKTAALCAAGAEVTAVDISAVRLERLTANLARLDLAARTVVADVLEWTPPERFDAVLLDAPCTATGTIRRHPDIPWLKSAEAIADMAAAQGRLLRHAVDLLVPGGRLVYCTCSLEPEEGEEQIARLIADGAPVERMAIDPAEVGAPAETLTATGELRTLPCHWPAPEPRMGGLDGFFISRLTKLPSLARARRG